MNNTTHFGPESQAMTLAEIADASRPQPATTQTIGRHHTMLDGDTMKPEFGLQAAHMLISELVGARLELTTRILMLEDQLKIARQHLEELGAKVGTDVLVD